MGGDMPPCQHERTWASQDARRSQARHRLPGIEVSRYREDSAVADERPQHLWRVGEDTVSVMTHLKPV